jgi:hypothetical protein
METNADYYNRGRGPALSSCHPPKRATQSGSPRDASDHLGCGSALLPLRLFQPAKPCKSLQRSGCDWASDGPMSAGGNVEQTPGTG